MAAEVVGEAVVVAEEEPAVAAEEGPAVAEVVVEVAQPVAPAVGAAEPEEALAEVAVHAAVLPQAIHLAHPTGSTRIISLARSFRVSRKAPRQTSRFFTPWRAARAVSPF